jgi:hypothetical protein
MIFALSMVIIGYIIALGATTVIDCISTLGARSPYWTQTAIRAHKVTKPLIVTGAILKLIGEIVLLQYIDFAPFHLEVWLNIPLLANAAILVFWASPLLLKREREKQDFAVLPTSMLRVVIPSFVISLCTWWLSLGLFILTIIHLIHQ